MPTWQRANERSRKKSPSGFSTPKRQITLAEPSRRARSVGVILMIRTISSVVRSERGSKKCLKIFFLPYLIRSPWTRGYSRKTILRYAQRKYIYAVNIMGKYYISKQSIINYLATDKAFRNTQKSEWHMNIVKNYTTCED